MVRILSIIVILLAGLGLIFSRQVGNKVERTKFEVMEAIAPYTQARPTVPPSPTLKILDKGKQVFQTFNNCGPASLSMALSYFGINVSQHVLGDALRPYQVSSGDNDDKSTTFAEMGKKAEEYGFVAYHRPGGNMELIKAFISQDIPVITRTWTKVGEDIGHFRVIKGYDEAKGVIVQDDSLQGANLIYTYEEFNKLWESFNFEYLVLVPKEKVAIAEAILGDDLDERTAWERVLANPTNEFNKLVALYHLGRYQEAVEIYERIKDTLPRRMLWYQIEPILAYQKVGAYDKVFEVTGYLIENGNRAFSEAYQIRGEVYEAQGKSAEAKAEFEKVLMYNKYFYKYWE